MYNDYNQVDDSAVVFGEDMEVGTGGFEEEGGRRNISISERRRGRCEKKKSR